ncbi:MAG: acetate--CoA ligase [Parachlamydiales bacterium]
MARALIFSFLLILPLALQGGTYFDPTFQKQANVADDSLFSFAHRDRVGFWEAEARHLDWFSEWDQALEWDRPYAKWFVNGKLNACYNCVDRHVLQGNGEKVAFYWEGEEGQRRVYTYRELLDEVCRFANVLKASGVGKGDRVAIYMPMVPEAVVAILGSARIGAVHTVIFGGIGAPSVREKIVDSEAKLLVTADGGYRRGGVIEYKRTVDTIIEECPSVERVIIVQRTGHQIPFQEERDCWYHQEVPHASTTCPAEAMDAEDLLFILYTSGTTGKAKGIIHTTGGYMVGVHSTFRWVFDHKPTDVYWSTADIGWITGHSYVVYGPMSDGATQVIYEGAPDYPHQGRLWEIAERYGVTIFYTAPTAIRCFMKWGDQWPSRHDLSSLRLLGSIGEPLNPAAWHWYYDHIGGQRCPIVDTWFQTETGAFVLSPLPGLTPLKPGSVTHPLPGFEAAVLDDEGNPAHEGHVAILSPYPSMLRGVFGDPDRYQSTYWSRWGGEYYFAGDKALCDEDGYIWVGGRADEVLKVAGHRIGTAEVENALVQHPKIAESAVVGIDDPLTGQAIVAFVVLREGHHFDTDLERALQEQVATYLGAYVRVREVIGVQELPKTRSGKILRRLLRNLLEDRPLGDTTSLENLALLQRLRAEVARSKLRLERLAALFQQVVEEPRFGPALLPVLRGGDEVAALVRPTLQQRIAATNYDRLGFANQFLTHYLTERDSNPTLSPIDALSTFLVDPGVERHRGSHCIGLTQDILDRLPSGIKGYFVAAQLPAPFQQPYAPYYCHGGGLIPFKSPHNPRDQGFVLLDPSFDIAEPLVLRPGVPVEVDMREKGTWIFRLEGNEIVCRAGPHPNGALWDAARYGGSEMRYRTDRYLNPVSSCILPLMLVDRRLSLLSRRADGSHLAHINMGLDWKQITWSIDEVRGDPIPFSAFSEEGFRFSPSFAELLFLSDEELNSRVYQVIAHGEVLDILYEAYIASLGRSR